MNSAHHHKLTRYSQTLRKNMTKEERRLWYDFLKTLPFPVYRQKVFGNYIVDFYIACASLVIEIDGSQHYYEEGQLADHQRDSYLHKQDLTVLRYSNRDVNTDFKGVCQDILNHVEIAKKPSP